MHKKFFYRYFELLFILLETSFCGTCDTKLHLLFKFNKIIKITGQYFIFQRKTYNTNYHKKILQAKILPI